VSWRASVSGSVERDGLRDGEAFDESRATRSSRARPTCWDALVGQAAQERQVVVSAA
jgi:hypothetical protein